MLKKLILLLFIASFVNPSAQANTQAIPQIEGLSNSAASLMLDVLSKLKRHQVTVKDHHGQTVVFEGFALSDVLTLAGQSFDKSHSSQILSSYLMVSAEDGYRAVFALSELDPGISDKMILLVDRKNGQALDESEGPWRLVIPGEKRQARWVRQISHFKVGSL